MYDVKWCTIMYSQKAGWTIHHLSRLRMRTRPQSNINPQEASYPKSVRHLSLNRPPTHPLGDFRASGSLMNSDEKNSFDGLQKYLHDGWRLVRRVSSPSVFTISRGSSFPQLHRRSWRHTCPSSSNPQVLIDIFDWTTLTFSVFSQTSDFANNGDNFFGSLR